MRISLNIDDELLGRAAEVTGLNDTAALVHAGLKALIERDAARYLASMGGTQKDLRVPPRRRPTIEPITD